MAKVDKTVLKETRLAVLFTAALTLVMNAVFLILSRWDMTVLWGSLLGLGGASLDFFLMGLGVQKAVSGEKKQAKNVIRLSQQGRLLMLAAVLVIAFSVPVFSRIAAVLPLFFPKIWVRLRAFSDPGIRSGGRPAGDAPFPDPEADPPADTADFADNGGDGA